MKRSPLRTQFRHNVEAEEDNNISMLALALETILQFLKCQILLITMLALSFTAYTFVTSGAEGIREYTSSFLLARYNSKHSYEYKIQRFQNWLLQNGAQIHANVTIESFPEYGGGYGILAKHGDVKYYDTLFEIPSHLILSVKCIVDMYSSHDSSNNADNVYDRLIEVPQIIRQVVSDGTANIEMLIEDVIISLQLMTENALHDKGKSKFGPYLDMLPVHAVPRLDVFSKEELAMLQDAQLNDLAMQSKDNIRRIWFSNDLQSLVLAMLKYQNQHSDLEDYDEQSISLESFHKYLTITGSRAMVLNGKKYLTPMPDFTNYSPRPAENDDRKIGEQSYSFNLYHYFTNYDGDKKGSMIIRADRSTSRGMQVFEDYGENDNSLYIEMFGFIPQENPFNCAILDLNRYYSETIIALFDKLNLVQVDSSIRKVKSWPSACVLEDGTLSHPYAEKFFAVASLADNKSQQQQCEDAIKSQDSEYITISCFRYSGFKEKVKTSINDAAKYTLNLKPTSLISDLEYLHSTSSLTQNSVTALLFRIREKGILSKILNGETQYDDNSDKTCQVEMSNLYESSSEEELALVENVHDFNLFIENNLDLVSNYLRASVIGNGMRIGAITTKSLNKGDTYFSFKDGYDISAVTAIEDTSNSAALKDLLDVFNSNEDTFHVLLFYLMAQMFVLKERSKWWSYLKLLPTPTELKSSSPLWFDDETLDFLSGSDLRPEILSYQRQVSNKFNYMMSQPTVVRALGPVFMRENYIWAHSIIDTRAIWYDGLRHLVPMLDLINCSSKPSTIHRTERGTNGHIETKAAIDFGQGDQILENYGQPNYIYMLYHGFTLNDNEYDCALFRSVRIDMKNENDEIFGQVKKLLLGEGFRSLNPTFCIKDRESLSRMERFLQIKHSKDDVGHELKEVLQGRLVRIDTAFQQISIDDNCMSSKSHRMRDYVKNEGIIILELLRNL